MQILVAILKVYLKSEVRMPDAAKIALFKETITAKHSLLVDSYCMVDGSKLYLQQAGDNIIQRHFYNGWKHDLPLHRMEASLHAHWMLQGHGMIPHWHIGDPCIPNSKNVGKITMAKC